MTFLLTWKGILFIIFCLIKGGCALPVNTKKKLLFTARTPATLSKICLEPSQLFLSPPFTSTPLIQEFTVTAEALLKDFRDINKLSNIGDGRNLPSKTSLLRAMDDLITSTFPVAPYQQILGQDNPVQIIWSGIHFTALQGFTGLGNIGIYTGQADQYFIKEVSKNTLDNLSEIYWMTKVHELGGPALYSVARTKTENIYFVMEKLFPHQHTINFKQLVKTMRDKLSRTFLAEEILPNFFAILKNSIAKNLQAILEHSVIAKDPDFMINPEGQARWFDVGQWELAKERSDILPVIFDILERLADKFGDDFSQSVLTKLSELLRMSNLREREELIRLINIQ